MPTAFPTVLWESLGKKSPLPPIPAKPSSLGIRQAQAKGQLKIVRLAKGAILKLDTQRTWNGLGTQHYHLGGY